MRTLALLFALLFPSISYSQAIWNGREYYAPVCNRANCQMCNSIRAQLLEQKIEAQNRRQRLQSVQRTPIFQESGGGGEYKVGDEANGFVLTLKTVNEVEYITESRRVCYTGLFGRKYCTVQQVRVPRTVQKQVYQWVPVQENDISKESIDLTKVDELVPTPQEAVDIMLALVQPTKDDILFDPGCGDGRILVTAQDRYGCKTIGIELNEESVELARSKGATVLKGDARNYSYQEATIVTMYLYPDLMKELVPLIPTGTRLVSYNHPIPGLDSKEHNIKGHTFYTATK